MHAKDIGWQFEKLAATYLQQYSVRIVDQNFCCKMGEIDLIFEDQECLVFAEVRYRSYAAFGDAAESVTYAKQQKIIRAAQFYIQTRTWAQNVTCRFDVLAISGTPTAPKINWIKDAFDV